MIACAEWLGRRSNTCTRGVAGCICNREDVLNWLTERHENCLAIAAGKPVVDRAGWIEDAQYFKAAIEIIKMYMGEKS